MPYYDLELAQSLNIIGQLRFFKTGINHILGYTLHLLLNLLEFTDLMSMDLFQDF